MSPEVMFHLEDIEKDLKEVKDEMSRFRNVISTVQNIKIDVIREEIQNNERLIKREVEYVNKYCNEVQDKIDACEEQSKRYSASLVMDSESLKDYCREYMQNYLGIVNKELRDG